MKKTRNINPEHIEALKSIINEGPFFSLLSMEICEIKRGSSRVEVQLNTNHHNLFGNVHGGVFASLIDVAAYWAVYCDLDENVGGIISIDLHVENLASARDGRLVVEGESIKVGRKICLGKATIYGNDGKMLAYGTSKMMTVDEIQSIGKYLENKGYPQLPPKFLE